MTAVCGRPGLAFDAGAPGAHAWVHAPLAAAHDFVAGAAGDFAAAPAAVGVSTLLVRSNLRVLGEMAAWLKERGVRGWRLVVPAGPVVDGVTPRLAVALPYALQAVARAEPLGIAAAIDGAPHCLLGPYRGRGGGAPRAYAAVCDGCPARGACPGVEAAYLERFGAGELSPRALRPATASPVRRDVGFAGTGRLVLGDMAPGTGEPGPRDRAEGTGPAGAGDMAAGTGSRGQAAGGRG